MNCNQQPISCNGGSKRGLQPSYGAIDPNIDKLPSRTYATTPTLSILETCVEENKPIKENNLTE